MWPTAAARDWKDTPGMATTGTNPDGSTRTRTDQLARAVYHWPTPTTGDAKASGSTQPATATHRPGVTLTDATVRMWATPLADGDRKAKFQQGGTPLGAQARQLWATPRCNTGGPDRTSEKHTGAPNLAAQARDFPTPTANRRDGLQSHGVNVVTGSLNPDWVCQLQGFPDGWLDLSDEALARLGKKKR